MKKILKKPLGVVLMSFVVFSVFLSMITYAYAKINMDSDKLPDGYSIVKKTDQNIAPGIVQSEVISNTQSGDMQQIDYFMEVDMSENSTTKIVASYGSDYNASSWELATMEEQVKGYEAYMKENNIQNETVVAAVNVDFFNMGTGEPLSALVMNGEVIKKPTGNYFCITKDGKAEIRTANQSLDDVEQAVGGGTFLVKDGVVQNGTDGRRMTRSAIGLKKDGTLVTYTSHGISDTSAGHPNGDVAKMMAAAGCYTAIETDGGGSATLLTKYEGTDSLEVRNSPSDGKLRSVSSGLIFVSTSVKDGVYNHSNITPNEEVYTPGQNVQFTATGVDSGGGEATIPDGVTWSVEDTSLGTIDKQSGLVTLKDKEGTLVVHQNYKNEVVGTASIEVRYPDEISFKTEEVSLGFEDSSTLGLEVRWKHRDVHLKDGDIGWELSNPEMGHFEGNTFISSDGKTLEGTITAYSKHDSSVKGEIHVIIGKLPTVAWDFEDKEVIDEETQETTIIPAKEYWKIGYGANAQTPYKVMPSSEDGTVGVNGEIIDIDTGEVRMGEHALKLSFDFTKSPDATRGAYFGTKDDFEIPGTPTAIGVWVYAPEGLDNFWLRGQVPYLQADGTWSQGSTTFVDFTYQPNQKLPDGSVVSQEDSGINWEGWKYLEADLTQKGATKFKLASGATFRVMYVPGIGMGSKTAGEIYLDNMQFVYGTNVDDTDSPVIDTMQYSTNNTEYHDFGENQVIQSNKVTFMSTFHDIENKYTKGIEYDLVRMYVDGVNVGVKGQTEEGDTIFADNFVIDDSRNTSYLYDMEFANGLHSIRMVIRDKAGNEIEQTKYFIIDGDENVGTRISFEASNDKNPVLGQTYDLILKTNKIEDINEISANISIDDDFINNYEVIWNEDFGEIEKSYNEYKNILTIRGKRNQGATSSGDGVIATLRLKMPTNIQEGSKFTYEVTNGEVTYNSEKSEYYAKSFSTKKTSIEIISPLTVTTDTIFVGKSGKVYVKDADGNKVEGASVYMAEGDVLLGTTNKDGYIETDELGKSAKKFSIYAKKDNAISFIFSDFAYQIGGNSDGTPKNIMSHVSSDPTTQKSVTWMTNPFTSEDNAVMQIAKTSDYMVSGDKAFSTVKGTTKIIKLDGSANSEDNHAFRLNSVIVSDLTPGTAYTYRVGDGNNFSKTQNFTTPYENKNVNFFVIGDIQTLNMDRTNKIANTLMANGIDYDFGLQTGDAVDNGAKYEYWDGITNLYGNLLNSTDMIHVFGNHEYEGDLSGSNSKAIYNIPNENNGDYYSFEYGNVYFAVINYTKDTNKLDRAMDWLVTDAKKSDATWKVVAVHQPPYFTNPTGGNDLINKILPPICDEADIDFVFSGHDHTYNRTKPLTGGKVDENGTVYMISGTTGDKTYPTTDTGFEFEKYITSFDGVYMSVSATANSFSIEAREANGNILDTYTRTKTFSCDEDGHEYEIHNDLVTCIHCKDTIPLSSFTGIAKDPDNGKLKGYIGGKMQTGWTQFGEEVYFFNKEGYSETVTIAERREPSCMVQEYTRYHCDAAENDYEIIGTRPPLHEYETQEDGSRICKVCGWKQIDISQLTIEQDYDAYYYNGSVRRPKLELSYTDENGHKTIFERGSEYLISYKAEESILPGKGKYEIIPIEVNIGDAVDRHRGSITGGAFTRTFDIIVRNPKTINATNVTKNAMTLSWDKTANVDGYELYQFDEKQNKYVLVDQIAGNENNTYTLNNLLPSESYKFKVRAYVEIDGETYYSSYSKEKTVKTESVKISAPKNLTGKNITNSSITVSWDKVTEADEYELYQYNSSTKKYDLIKTLTENSYNVTNLQSQKTYTFKVRAYVVENEKAYYSGYCDSKSFKTLSKTEVPTSLPAPKLEPIKASKGVLALSWNKVDNVTGYNIYHYNRQTLKYENIAWTKNTSIELKDQPKGEIDTYRVKAYYKSNGKTISSVYSNSQSAKLFDSTAIKNVEQDKNALKLTWSAVKGTNGYSIYRREDSQKEWEYLGATSQVTYTDKSAKEGVRYQYRVLPYGKVNGVAFFGPYSKSVSGMVFKEMKITDSKAYQDRIELTWEEVPGTDGYNVYRYNEKTKEWDYMDSILNKTTYTDKKVEKGNVYRYQIRPYYRTINDKVKYGQYSDYIDIEF